MLGAPRGAFAPAAALPALIQVNARPAGTVGGAWQALPSSAAAKAAMAPRQRGCIFIIVAACAPGARREGVTRQ